MREALILMHGRPAGHLREHVRGGACTFAYLSGYSGPPVSLMLPVREEPYRFDGFPPFFDGLLPEGWQLNALLRHAKIDPDDRFTQLVRVGADLVGAVTVVADEEA